MYALSGEISGTPIDDMGDWFALVSRLYDELLNKSLVKEAATVKDILTKPCSIYLAGANFWVELKEMI